MDFYAVPIIESNASSRATSKDAYYLARDEGKYSNRKKDTIDYKEIAKYPAKVTYEDYIYYSNLTFLQLLYEFPEIEAIIDDPTYEDVFYWATRGWLPNYPHLKINLERWRQYDNFAESTQMLLDLLYGDRYNYAMNYNEDVERIILAYEYALEDLELLFIVATRYGFSLPLYDDPAVTLYYKIKDYIKNNADYNRNRIRLGLQ